MARHDGDLRTKTDQALGIDELLGLLGDEGEPDTRARQDAIACYLSGSDGWREAMKRLRGAFAEVESGLRDRKLD